MDKLIEEAVATGSAVKRRALYHEILEIGFRDEPSIVTVRPSGVLALRDWVRGFYDNPVFLGLYYYPLSKSEGK
jgi:peptide/nickel transport system substrate-binding protein